MRPMEGEPESARRYVRLPEDCVSLCAENLGIQASREVTSSLTEDVSFRIRQITSVSASTRYCWVVEMIGFTAVFFYSWPWSLCVTREERSFARRTLIKP